MLLLCPLAQAQTITQHTTRVTRPGYYRLETTYPRTHRRVGDGTVREPCHRRLGAEAAADVSCGDETVARERQTALLPIESQITSFSHYASPSLYSVGMQDYLYEDGAHGGLLRVTFNFALVNGQPKRLSLADFFTTGSDYRSQVEKILLAKLHKDPRALFIGTVTALTPAQLNRFVVESDGLRFWFDQYEVAPYSAGPVDVKLTIAELGPDFRRSLYAKR